MTNSKSDVEELKNLQREASEQRAERKQPRSRAKSAAGQKSEPTEHRDATKKPSTQDPTDEEPTPESEQTVQDLEDQLESVVQKIEEVARERPVLTLLAVFTTGVIVGHVLSRR